MVLNMSTKYTIQDIFLEYGEEYVEQHKLSKEQWKVYNAIRNCGTKKLGYHICTCEKCGSSNFSYSFKYNAYRSCLK